MKRVLITGARSYIGESFEKYANEHYSDELEIETVDMLDSSWREKDFSRFDSVFHVAGVAHVDIKNPSEEQKKEYYSVNTDLAIETANKARTEGVRQFVFMSSIIIYGNAAPCGKRRRILPDEEPRPTNVYGDSKWQADQGVRKLASESFHVCVLRPPMIYGKGCKGNYPLLSKIAKNLPAFPNIKNERSMLYIENLCEFLCQIMIKGEGGTFWPQNAEHVCTSEMVKTIGMIVGHKMIVSSFFNWCVYLAMWIPGKSRALASKAFGNISYDQNMSKYDFEYQIIDFKTSIERTEK